MKNFLNMYTLLLIISFSVAFVIDNFWIGLAIVLGLYGLYEVYRSAKKKS